LVVLTSATGVAAERNLIPTLNREPHVCTGQSPEPDWMQALDARDAHKRLLVQQIYRAQSMERIVDAQDCACPTRFPAWEGAETTYFESFAAADRWEIVEATSDYRRRANTLRQAAMTICEAAGNW
jgi:hypothetical protein